MDTEKKKTEIVRCRHCGGPMRLYRDGINCLMCGRTPEHRCEYCRHTEEQEAAARATQRKVA